MEPINNYEEGALGKPPGWGLYWGNTVVFALLTASLLGAWLFRYPDVVEAPVRLSTLAPPARIAPAQAGPLTRLLAREGDTVVAGQTLAIMGNPAQLDDVLALGVWLAGHPEPATPLEALSWQLPDRWQLGELQARYAALQSSLAELQYWIGRQIDGNRMRQLQKQYPRLQEMAQTLDAQLQLAGRESEIADSTYRRISELYQRGAATRTELDNAATLQLQARQQTQRLRNQIDDNRLAIERLGLEQIQLGEGLSDQAQRNWLSVRNELRQLRAELAGWEQRYLLRAPIAGKATWLRPLQPHDFLAAGEPILAVTPIETNAPIAAQGVLPAASAGKVTLGAQVRIRLDAFPYREFGALTAQVSDIALAGANDSQNNINYRLQLELPQQMTSTYGRKLAFRQDMSGVARIVTAERSLLERLFDRLRDLRHNN
jgi:multidrug resistance efflux pump